MAKSMARLADSIVINLEWHSDITPNDDALVAIGDYPVTLGDTYVDGRFYHEGEVLLTPLELAQAVIEAKDEEIQDLDEAFIAMAYENILLELGV